jgi:NADPH2:quinone reductase
VHDRDRTNQPVIAGRFPLVEAKRVRELLGDGGITGKLALVCDDATAR